MLCSSVRKQHCLVVQCYNPFVVLLWSLQCSPCSSFVVSLWMYSVWGRVILTYTIYRYVRLQLGFWSEIGYNNIIINCTEMGMDSRNQVWKWNTNFRGQVWKRVPENLHNLVWNRVRVWRAKPHSDTTCSKNVWSETFCKSCMDACALPVFASLWLYILWPTAASMYLSLLMWNTVI